MHGTISHPRKVAEPFADLSTFSRSTHDALNQLTRAKLRPNGWAMVVLTSGGGGSGSGDERPPRKGRNRVHEGGRDWSGAEPPNIEPGGQRVGAATDGRGLARLEAPP